LISGVQAGVQAEVEQEVVVGDEVVRVGFMAEMIVEEVEAVRHLGGGLGCGTNH